MDRSLTRIGTEDVLLETRAGLYGRQGNLGSALEPARALRNHIFTDIAMPTDSTESASASLLRCPREGSLLLPTLYENIEIDACGGCGGSWLNRGELERAQETPGTGGRAAVRELNAFVAAFAAAGALNVSVAPPVPIRTCG